MFKLGQPGWGPCDEDCQLIWCMASGTSHPGRFFIIKSVYLARIGGGVYPIVYPCHMVVEKPAWCWSRFKEPPPDVYLLMLLPGRKVRRPGAEDDAGTCRCDLLGRGRPVW
jgi:hypothetical protein